MKLYQDLAKEPLGFTPRQIAHEISVPQLWAIFLGGKKARREGEEEEWQPQTPEEILAWANKRREKLGLPPARMVWGPDGKEARE